MWVDACALKSKFGLCQNCVRLPRSRAASRRFNFNNYGDIPSSRPVVL